MEAFTNRSCPKCANSTPSFLKESTLAYACAKCGSYALLDTEDKWKNRHTFDLFQNDSQAIPIGTTGTLNGLNVVVVGFAIKRQVGTKYDWREYTLFNEFIGILWLVEFNGHWSMVTRIHQFPRISGAMCPTELDNQEEVYHLFNDYSYVVKYAVGEFSYDIFLDKQKDVAEWVTPGHMIIRELANDEVVWLESSQVSLSDLRKFSKESTFPERIGIGAVQKQIIYIKPKLLISATIICVLLLSLIQILLPLPVKEKLVYERTVSKSDLDTAGVFIGDMFAVGEGRSAVQVELYSPLDNNWLDIDFELVNNETGERFDGAKSIEFYHGYDSEGSWSEGQQKDYLIISAVPGGNYHLNFYPQFNPQATLDSSFRVRVFQGVSLISNLVWFTVCLAVITILLYYGIDYFEKQRWEGSSYNYPGL